MTLPENVRPLPKKFTFAMAVAAPTIQKELGLSIVEMPMILTVYFRTYAVGQRPAGRLAGRIGSRTVLSGTSARWSLMMIVTPFGATFAWLFGCRRVSGGARTVCARGHACATAIAS